LFRLVQPIPQKHSAFIPAQITGICCLSHPLKGRIMIVGYAGWDAVDAGSVVAQGECRAVLWDA
jgi:hypothetical protein